MLLLSTGKSTILSDFADLETKSIYSRKNAEASDFRFYPGSNVFVEVHKKSGVEMMRVKGADKLGISPTEISIQKIMNLNIENVYCVGCAHQIINEITFGLNNGEVWIFDHAQKKVVQRFYGERRNSVVFVDYNSADDYIAATHENGLINIYGYKTHAKIQTINIDSRSLLARFHPTKRFYLAITSHKGAVSVYDVAAKRKLFHTTDSHNAPCRDCSWSPSSVDTLISVGYDCNINIFDTRRKTSAFELNQPYPLSTVAYSDCGNFFCVGDLKGQMATFDTRNLKKSLNLKKVHDGAVQRVAFVPEFHKNIEAKNLAQNESFSHQANASAADVSSGGQTAVETTSSTNVVRSESSDLRKSLRLGQRDSFCDFMDFQISKGFGNTNRLTALGSRDSMDWENLAKMNRATNRGSAAFAISSNLSPIESDPKEDQAEILENKSESAKTLNLQPLRERNVLSLSSNGNKLVQISEEKLQQQQPPQEDLANNTTKDFDKENTKENSSILQHEFVVNRRESMPTHASDQQQSVSAAKSDTDIIKQISQLRADMTERLNDLEYELKLEGERNKWQLLNMINNFGCKQRDALVDLRAGMMFLLQTDPFVQEFTRLKDENKVLKEQLERAIRKN